MTARARWFVAALTLLLASGCVPARPDDEKWREDGSRTLSDVAGQLATAALVLDHDDDLLGGYDVVVVTTAEETAGTSADSFTGQQPPEADQALFDRVSTALDDATSLLTDARIALVRDDTAAYPGLERRLRRLDAKLHRLATELEGEPR